MSLRIAMVVDPWSLPFNGTVVSTRRFVFALAAEGYRIRVLAIDADPAVDSVAFQRLSIPGFNRIINTMRAPLARPERSKLRAALQDCDVLHVQFPFFLGHAAIGEAKRRGIPVVCSFHVQPENILLNLGITNRFMRNLLYRFFVARFFNRADSVVVPSEFGARMLGEQGVESPVHVISNGVPAEFFDVPDSAREDDRFRVLSIGRLAPEKQHEVLLRAVARSSFSDRIDLTLAGAGPREERLRGLALALGINVRIEFFKEPDLIRLLGEADLVVHTSTIELEGMSVTEAMAAGRVVVVSDAPDSACADLVVEPRERFRVGDAEDLRERIDYWLSHPLERQAQGAANRRAAKQLSHPRSVKKLADIYRALCGVSESPDIERHQRRGA